MKSAINSFLEKIQGKKIIVILPAYNEAGKIGNTVKKIKESQKIEFPIDVLVVNDGSTDDTSGEAWNSGAIVIDQEKNQGVGAAIRSGIFYGLEHSYDIMMVMAGDDQDDPDEIPDVLEPIIMEDCDFVQGSRRARQRQTVNISLFRRITTKMYSIIFSVLTMKRITDGTNGFRAFKASIFKHPDINLNQSWLNTYELEPYLFYKAVTLGFKYTEVQVTKFYHESVGYTKMKPVIDWWRILRPLLYLRLGIRK